MTVYFRICPNYNLIESASYLISDTVVKDRLNDFTLTEVLEAQALVSLSSRDHILVLGNGYFHFWIRSPKKVCPESLFMMPSQ